MLAIPDFVSTKIRLFLLDRRNRDRCWDVDLYKKQLYAAYYGATLRTLHRIAVEHRIRLTWQRDRSWALPLLCQRGCVNLTEPLDIPFKITRQIPSSAVRIKIYTYTLKGDKVMCDKLVVDDLNA